MIKKLYIIVFAVAYLFSASFANAQAWLLSAPTGPTSGLAVLHLINNLTNWLFVGFMLLAVVVIVLAGWQFITGGGAPESVSNARKKLLWAGVAVIIALMSRGIPVVVASILGVGGGGGGGLPPLPPPPVAFAVYQGGSLVATINPVETSTDVASVYSFNTPSPTGYNGGAIVPSVSNESMIFLHKDTNTNEVSIVVVHGGTGGTGGQVSVDYSGAALIGASIPVQDDPNGPPQPPNDGPYTISGAGNATIHNAWGGGFTDGLAVSNINWPSSCVEINPTFITGVNSWLFVNSSLSRISLDMAQPVSICLPPNVPAASAPPAIAHWDFNDLNTLDTIVDKAGANNGTYDPGAEGWHAGTLNGTVQTAGSPGNGQARSFNGTSDYISLGNNELGNFPDAFTLTAWVRLNKDTGQQAILSEYHAGVCGDSNFMMHNGRVTYHDGSASVPNILIGNTTIPVNQWHHVAVVSDVGDIRVYLDGNLDGTLGSDLNWRNLCATTDVRIGNRIGPGGVNQDHFDGDMDELRVYKSEAFTQAQIAADMSRSYPIIPAVASYNFENATGAPDNHHQVASNTGFGAAAKFDQVDDYVNMGNVLNMGTGDFSIGIWVKDLQGSGTDYVVGKWDHTALAGYVMIYDSIGGTGGMISNGLDSSARGITSLLYNNNTTPSDPNNLHHIMLVTDRSLDMKMYIDGVLDNSDAGAITTEPGSIDNVLDFRIGVRNSLADFAGGLIDDVKIWNQALTAAEVAAEFSAGP